jgi:glucosyl-dolichyl phosphate glucuronosyltransferase
LITASIIIPTYNRAALLKEALHSVRHLWPVGGISVDVIVVDNASTDATAEVVGAFAASAGIPVRRVVETSQGLNHGRNRGIVSSTADWLIYLDDDMRVHQDWLTGFACAIAEFQADAVIGPVEPWFEETPAPWLTRQMLDPVTSVYSLKGGRIHLVGRDVSHELPGCNFAVLRSAAIEAGGFHPALDRSGKGMLAGGDVEFGMRLAKLGKRVVYSPKCRISHFISNAKISRDGLRSRCAGGGATRRAIEALHLEQPSVFKQACVLLRMAKNWLRSLTHRLLGHDVRAFECELVARRLKGYLFDAPRGLKAVNQSNLTQYTEGA